jgi:thiopurine S-methyltransferase
MEHEFWSKRWAEGQTGWHAQQPNESLVAQLEQLRCQPGDPVLVPLAGKTLDLAWLAKQPGLRPIGVEWAEQAVVETFEQAGLRPERERLSEAVELWHGGGIAVLCADWFAVDASHLAAATASTGASAPIRAWWDRASLIALPKDLRCAYAKHLRELLPAGAHGLLLSLEYPSGELAGPPFSVGPAEVRDLFEAGFKIEELALKDALAHDKRRQAQGVTRLDERLYLLQRR